jgi:hypothetical protein
LVPTAAAAIAAAAAAASAAAIPYFTTSRRRERRIATASFVKPAHGRISDAGYFFQVIFAEE